MRIAILGAGPGGTWNLNRYPGWECDVQSALYSFSFEIKPDWSKPYGTQPEILAYMRGVAEKYGLMPHVRPGDGVRRAVWDDRSASRTLTLDSGPQQVADVVVSAIGMFNDLAWPEVEGLDRFWGTQFHSAQWPFSVADFQGRTATVDPAAFELGLRR